MNFLALKDISERSMELVNPTSPEKILTVGRVAGLKEGSRVIDFGSGFGEVLVLERKSRALQRMLTTSMGRAEIIAGHMLAMFAVVFLQEIILIVVGQSGFGVNYLREPLAVLLVMIALALWVSSLGLFIGATAKGEERRAGHPVVARVHVRVLGVGWRVVPA